MNVYRVLHYGDEFGIYATRDHAEAMRLRIFEEAVAEGRKRQAAQTPERAAWGREIEAGGMTAIGWSLPRERDFVVIETPVEGSPLGITISRLVADAHANSVAHGFWEGQDREGDFSFVPEKLALLHSEVSEMLEVYRNPDYTGKFLHVLSAECGKCRERGSGFRVYEPAPDGTYPCPAGEHGPAKPEGFASELADVLIRAGDLAGRLGIDLDRAVREKMAYNATRPMKHGKVC